VTAPAASSFVRTVLGDVDPAELGVTYAHEHLVIAGGRPVEIAPDLRLDSVDDAVSELAPAVAVGLRTVVDAMPCDAGRDVSMLAEISRRAGVHVIAPTGLHHERWYDDRHWSRRLDAERLAALFVADIEDGIDANDYGGPVIDRTPHRAGVIKVAGSTDGPSARDVPIFEAAAIAHRRTGCPILTHCEHGTGGLEQLRLLQDHGVDPSRVALSHVDKVVDRGYHRALAATGAMLEYDQSFRWPDATADGTTTLIEWALEDGHADRVLLGMDAARRRYWAVHGGTPGMGWLLGPYRERLLGRGVAAGDLETLFVANPARYLAFAPC
jgi:predicted metal-dependent phosphotriesterase family hydrolase